MPLPGAPTSSRATVAAAPIVPAPLPGIDRHLVSFAGSGVDYFKLWLSNLLLTIVTLGIYTPWARRRRIQYFFRNTEVGADPLDFTASSGSMAKSFLLVVLIYLLIKVMSSQGLNTAVSAIILLIALAVPWLWRSAMRFRMGNITWRGLPFEFQASTREAYQAAWPLLGVAVFAAALALWLPAATDSGKAKVGMPGPVAGLLIAGGFLLVGAVLIRLRFNFLHLQMTRTSLGGQMSGFKASFSDFFKVGLICLGIGVGAYVLVIGLMVGFAASIMGVIGAAGAGSGAGKVGGFMILAALFLLLLLPLLLIPASITLAAWQAMVFRTVWSNAGLSRLARSKCHLKTRDFVLLRTKNVFLTLLTLGFYKPFAAVSEYRMKVESVTVYTRGDINALANLLASGRKNALGDAAADLAGFDLAV
jgi:uncharacterized membrane protein YjgN (DUF898 family)